MITETFRSLSPRNVAASLEYATYEMSALMTFLFVLLAATEGKAAAPMLAAAGFSFSLTIGTYGAYIFKHGDSTGLREIAASIVWLSTSITLLLLGV